MHFVSIRAATQSSVGAIGKGTPVLWQGSYSPGWALADAAAGVAGGQEAQAEGAGQQG